MIHLTSIGSPTRLLLIALALLLTLAGCRSVSDSLFETGRGALRGLNGLKSGTVLASNGQSIAYLERAGDGPVVVLIHGFASEKDVWLRFLRSMPRRYRVIALDLPGHGDSSRDPEFHYDIPAMVTAVEDTVGELVTEPAHVVGTSLGGMIATLYTARNADDVTTLALYAPAGVYPPNPSPFQLALDNGENPLIATNADEFNQLMKVVFHDPPPLIWPVGPALRRYTIERAPFHQKVWDDLWADHPTVNEVLPQIDLPVLLVWGREDQVLDVSSVEVFESLLPDVQTEVFDNLGHASINEKPRKMARLHRDFIDAQP